VRGAGRFFPESGQDRLRGGRRFGGPLFGGRSCRFLARRDRNLESQRLRRLFRLGLDRSRLGRRHDRGRRRLLAQHAPADQTGRFHPFFDVVAELLQVHVAGIAFKSAGADADVCFVEIFLSQARAVQHGLRRRQFVGLRVNAAVFI